MTVTLQAPRDSAVATADVRYASWGARLGALALDVGPGAAVAVVAVFCGLTTSPGSVLRWTFVAVAALGSLSVAVSRWVLPVLLGWSVGRAVTGIEVVRRDGNRPSMVRLFLRDLAHLLDTGSAFVGWCWPLWDARHRTFADLLLRTEVRGVEATRPGARTLAARVLAGATVVGVACAALGFATVYRQDRAEERARSEIADQGPRIVERLLSYNAATVGDDFAKARSLTTDDYRQQLVAQQQSIETAGPVTNEFWSTNSAVLAASPSDATMLLALQGQRGNDPKQQRFITATVRAEFVKSAGQWQVSHLTVLKRPQGKAPAR